MRIWYFDKYEEIFFFAQMGVAKNAALFRCSILNYPYNIDLTH